MMIYNPVNISIDAVWYKPANSIHWDDIQHIQLIVIPAAENISGLRMSWKRREAVAATLSVTVSSWSAKAVNV
jgi:hypothetical protein